MAAHLEDGFTRTANEILDHLMKQRLNGTQHCIIYCVIRNTYGFQRKSHALSLTFISNATGIHKDLIKRELDKLIEFKVIRVFKEAGFRTTREIGINKSIEDWEIHSEPKRRQSANQSTVYQSVVEQSTNQSTPTVDESVYQERKSFKDIKNNTTTAADRDFDKVSKAYGRIHGKYDVEPRYLPLLTKLLNEGMTADFMIEVMEQRFHEKELAGEKVSGFGYYENVFRDKLNQRFKVLQGKKTTNWDEIQRKLEEAERGSKPGA